MALNILFSFNKRIIITSIAGVWLALSGGGCRVAKEGSRDPVNQGDATVVSPGTMQPGRPPTIGGDPRVTLITAPCGNGPDVEVFLARARGLAMVNRLAKLPAAEWRVTFREKNLSVCAFMAAEKIDLAFFRIVPTAGQQSCAPCVVEVQRNAKDPLMPVLYASDPQGSLLRMLASKTEPETSPWFVVHKSGYGFFSNTKGPTRNAMPADFEVLGKQP